MADATPRSDGRLDPREVADRLLHGIDLDRVRSTSDRIAVARAQLRLAEIDEQRIRNILDALLHADLSDFDKAILKATLRRRLRILPLVTVDGSNLNGGN